MAITKMVSIDSSSTKSGVAYFENGILKDHKVLDCSTEKNTVIRVENMCFELINYLKSKNPNIVVIEKPPFMNSPQTLIMLAEIVGCVKGWAITQGFCEFVEYMPNEWRSLIKEKDEKIPRKREDCKIWDLDKVYFLYPEIVANIVDDNDADAILIGRARINAFS